MDELDYFAELRRAQTLLGEQGWVFVGQSVGVGGTSMAGSWDDVPVAQRVEFPVAEELQMGYCTGMALRGGKPVCVFPRWNFVLRAADQLINHLDRLHLYSDGGYTPKVVIRTAIPSNSPFDPGPQHDDDFTVSFQSMCRLIKVVRLFNAASIVPAYQLALERQHSTILVEFTEKYRNERGKVQEPAAE